MTLNMTREIAILKNMTVGQLKDKYQEVFGEPTNSYNKQFLIKRIAWRMQANLEGGLSERARKRAMELANDADLRIRPPSSQKMLEMNSMQRGSGDKSLMPGMVLTRPYKGRTIIVTVLENGFEYEGKVFRSLTSVTEEITGTHWNGYNFFKQAIQGKGVIHAAKPAK